jgi:predicted dehydrogenase
MKVGIAGAIRGAALLPGFRASPHAEVVALCDPDGERLNATADRYGIPHRYGRFAEMLDAIDIAVVASPMPLHVPQALLALEAGKHVLSEVPAAVTLEECWRLLDGVLASDRTYMMAENVCYYREKVLVKEMVRKGLFGEPYFAEGQYLHQTRHLHVVESERTWRYYWQVGVNGCTYGTHSLGPVMQWLKTADPSDRIESVICVGAGRHTDPQHAQEDTNITLCRLKSGKLVEIRLDLLSNRPMLNVYHSLQGTRGVYEAARTAGEPGRIWIGESIRGERRQWCPVADFEEHLPARYRNPPPEALAAGHEGGDFWQVLDFMEAVITSGPSPIDIYDSLEWTAAGLCSQLSIANGGVAVRVPDFRDPSQRPPILDAPPLTA